jgi:hypothetical protein
MATSNEKIVQLAEALPQLVAALGMGALASGALTMLQPMIDGEVRKLAAMPTDELDELISQGVGYLSGLQSDEPLQVTQ